MLVTTLLLFTEVHTFFAATSYCPLLAKVHHVLFEDAAWGFGLESSSDKELHVNRVLNVVGSGAQHSSFFRDFSGLLCTVFSSQDVSKQPAFVVDTGCGNGALLAQIYACVKERTPRGRVLKEYPLVMVGVDFNAASRETTSANLAEWNVPHMVLTGDIGNPASIVDALAQAGVKPSQVIHVRSFLDHDRPFIPPIRTVAEGSALAAFVKRQFDDTAHLDKSGNLLSPAEVYLSLVEHFERWGHAVDNTHGLCLLEVMGLDIPSTRRSFCDNVSFHFDIEEALSRQYLVSPVAFHLALGEAGLFSQLDYRDLQTYPESDDCVRVLSQHIVKRPFRVRLAEMEDLPHLLRLEDVGVAKNLRADPATIKQRLQSGNCEAFVVEDTCGDRVAAQGESKLLAAVYTTRVAREGGLCIDILQSGLGGPVMQIVALTADPEGYGTGGLLRDFLLQLARLDPTVHRVVGITRCEGWRGSKQLSLEEYVSRHQSGQGFDKILGFHTALGAEIVGVLPGVRPQDRDNAGSGVLVRYNVTLQGCRQLRERSSKSSKVLAKNVGEIEQAVWEALARGGFAAHVGAGKEDRFAVLGLDSLDLAKLRETLSQRLGTELPASLLLEHPSVASLAQKLCLNRRNGKGSSANLVRSALADLGFDGDGIGSGICFLGMGLDSIDLERLRHRLAEGLGFMLPASVCLEHPSPAALSRHLETLRNS